MAKNLLKFVQGEEKDITVTVKDASENAVDLTGATGFFSVKENKNDADGLAIIAKDTATASEMELTDPTNGIAVIHILEADTASVAPKEYFYDIKFKLAGGDIHVVTLDSFVVEQNITQKSTP